MVQVTISGAQDLMMDENDPEEGDIKVVQGTLLSLDTCDSLARWEVVSGAGVQIEIDETMVAEGTGSVKVNIPHGITAVVKCTIAAGVWDISTYKYLRVRLKSNLISWTNPYLYFGENLYNEQSNFIASAYLTSDWKQRSWDISAIDPGDRDAVTIFAFSCQNAYPSGTHSVWLDEIFADPGPSAIRANDGNRIINLAPKILTGSYASSAGPTRTILLERKGTPTYVRVIKLTRAAITWISGMGASSHKDDDNTTLADGITGAGNGEFYIGNHVAVNGDGGTYHYFVAFDD